MKRALSLVACLLVASAAAATSSRAAESETDGQQGIEDGLDAARPALDRCWEKAAADGWRLQGKITLQLTFDKAGKVKKVKLVSDDTGDAVLQKCVLDLARTWTWAMPAGVVEIPIGFSAPAAQYTVRREDVPVGKPKGGKIEMRILLDQDNVGAEKASLVELSLMGSTQVPLHRHTGLEILYVLDGNVRVDGLGGKGKGDLAAGDVAYLPAGMAHGFFATCCKRKYSKYLILYAPAGIERPYKDAAARREGTTTTVDKAELAEKHDGEVEPLVVKAVDVKALPIGDGKGTVKILVDEQAGGDGAAYVGHLLLEPGAVVAEHVHAKEAEILYILAGEGELTVAGGVYPVAAGMAVHIPAGAKHAFKVTSKTAIEAVQFYAPGGPEQRFKKKSDKQPEKKIK